MSNKSNVPRSLSSNGASTSDPDSSSTFFNNIKSAIRSASLSTNQSDDYETIEPENESEGLLSKYSQKLRTAAHVGAFINKSKNLVQGAQESMQHSLNFTKYLPYIIMLCIGGAFFLFIAFMFAPMIFLFPQKFSSCFALGCLCFIGAIALVRGPKKFLMSFVQQEKLKFTIIYVISVVGTLLSSKVVGSYLLALVFAGAQVISLLWLIAASVPGGTKVAGTIQGFVISCCKGAFQKLFGSGEKPANNNKSFLPF